MNIKELKASYKDTLKSMDTEETIDLCFYRPIGYMWAVLCAKLGIKPNAITIASIFIGVAAGVMFYFNDLWLNIVGCCCSFGQTLSTVPTVSWRV